MRKRLFCVWLTLCLLCLQLPCAKGETEISKKLNALFVDNDTLGASVAVFQNGEITFTHTFGTLAPNGDPVTENTLFQVGSISKMVGNIGLLQLLHEQKIPLDTSLSEIFGFPIFHPLYPKDDVTIRQLMTHTSGLRDQNEYYKALEGRGKTLGELFENQRGLMFQPENRPGYVRQYSNFGGGLIGAMVEALSGETLDHYMQKHVFEPLGVTAAYQIGLLPASLPAADLYPMPREKIGKKLRSGEKLVTEPNPEKHYIFTAGKLIISAGDLCKILIALCDGGVYENTRILPESMAEEMLTPQNHRGSVYCEAGHGLFVNIHKDLQVEGRTLYGHGGKAYGMLCAAYFDPADRTGVVMLTNGCDNHATPSGVGYLGKEILTLCYREIIEPNHETRDPFLVQ